MPQFTFQVFLLLATSYLIGVVIGFIIRSFIGSAAKKQAEGAVSASEAALVAGTVGATALAANTLSETNNSQISQSEAKFTDLPTEDLVEDTQQDVVEEDTTYQTTANNENQSDDPIVTDIKQESEEIVESHVEEVLPDTSYHQESETIEEVQPVIESVKEEVVEAETEIHTPETAFNVVSESEVISEPEEVVEDTTHQTPEAFDTEDNISEAQETSNTSEISEEVLPEAEYSEPSLITETSMATDVTASSTNSEALKSLANKGRMIGVDSEENEDLILETLSDSDLARLSKDRPIRKPSVVKAKALQGDDLKQIKGIGVIAESQLKSMGIKSYSQIANWSDDEITKFDRVLNSKGKISSEKWVAQAKDLSESD